MHSCYSFIRSATVAIAIISLNGCSNNEDVIELVLPTGSNVVALGDSLTYGYSVDRDLSYPAVLADMTGWKIINAGVNGNTSANVLWRIDTVIAQNPDLVLLSVGGNNVLRRVPSEVTAANITTAVKQLKAANIDVILIAQPYFSASALFGRASDNPIYASIAKSENVPLYSKRWSEVISNNALKSDQIHANAAGYRYFAEGLYAYLQQNGVAR
ncbi:GDSL-type esterase/lipase family protein [Psychrobacter sp. M13]|uniref:GDSL-type esterase/lipase family protein n=1 Tax=Psychrobacter sp. M13 TaxID=3067275 RepID=UPI00273BD084|nr:GDSL-type esterase/lipase family protein [Psychrobacter sp. M13]WLP95775.1 GDSL-type esterase/lipase family protein [Psychrobacter sp. M13]